MNLSQRSYLPTPLYARPCSENNDPEHPRFPTTYRKKKSNEARWSANRSYAAKSNLKFIQNWPPLKDTFVTKKQIQPRLTEKKRKVEN